MPRSVRRAAERHVPRTDPVLERSRDGFRTRIPAAKYRKSRRRGAYGAWRVATRRPRGSPPRPCATARRVPFRGAGLGVRAPGPGRKDGRKALPRPPRAKASMSWQRAMQSMARGVAALGSRAQPEGSSGRVSPWNRAGRCLRGKPLNRPNGPGHSPSQASRVRRKNFIRQWKHDEAIV